jgi:hypothetical protein
MALAGGEILENIHHHAKSWLPARSIVEESIATRKEVDSCERPHLCCVSCSKNGHEAKTCRISCKKIKAKQEQKE